MNNKRKSVLNINNVKISKTFFLVSSYKQRGIMKMKHNPSKDQ